MPIDADHFRAILSRFASGVTVVTIRDADLRDHGMTVTAFSSLSLKPPLVLVCIDDSATLAPTMSRVDSFAINILQASQEPLSRRFAGVVDDRFAGLEFSRAPMGNVVLDGVVASMECRVMARHAAGDHTIVIGEVQSGAVAHAIANSVADTEPLLYFRGDYAHLAK